MLLSNLEYISLRLLRRFIFSDAFLLRWGRLLPYYRTNTNQTDPEPIVSEYARHLPPDFRVQSVLEIGVGATNSTGYELAARIPTARLTLLEPFVSLDEAADKGLLAAIARRHAIDPADLSRRVERINNLGDIPPHHFDLILSSSVLEHVSDPARLFSDLKRVLQLQGRMVHLVDYRDHFFKYPFHFLQFSRAVWMRWLNPGDLLRWRAYDHRDLLHAAGFSVTLAEVRYDEAAFSRISARLSPDFRREDPLTSATYAAIVARPKSP